MIPYLYESTETAFTSNGIGRLVDAISCTVTEERNGVYELEMEYPITGKRFDEIQNSRIIAAVPAEGKAKQPFRIYRIEKPLDGICTIHAEHISYQLSLIPVMPFKANTCAEALAGFANYAVQTCPFAFWTNKATVANYSVDYPRPIRELLGGSQGSILDVFGSGEYEFDTWLVKLYVNRGVDSGVVIRYAKNLTDLTNDEDLTDVYTGVCPYWMDTQTGELVTLPEKAVWAPTAANFPYKRTVVVDFSQEWQTKPTVAQLRQRANKYITDNNIGIPKTSIKVSFVNLADVEGVSVGEPSSTLVIPARVEGDTLKGVDGTVNGDTVTLHNAYWKVSYDKYKVLERVNLCDTIKVVYDALGVSVTAEVVKTVYNVLLDRYDEIEIGDPKTTLAQQVVSLEQATQQAIVKAGFYANQVANTLTQYVDEQTSLITGGQGGFIVFGYNADGQPEEMFIMDTADMATATNVIRLNKNGIGFSNNGINGPYTSAWTINGVFNADFIGAGSISANLITVGTMLADRILGGTLRLGGSNNGNGVLEIYNAAGTLIGRLDSDGATLTGKIKMVGSSVLERVEQDNGSMVFPAVTRTTNNVGINTRATNRTHIIQQAFPGVTDEEGTIVLSGLSVQYTSSSNSWDVQNITLSTQDNYTNAIVIQCAQDDLDKKSPVGSLFTGGGYFFKDEYTVNGVTRALYDVNYSASKTPYFLDSIRLDLPRYLLGNYTPSGSAASTGSSKFCIYLGTSGVLIHGPADDYLRVTHNSTSNSLSVSGRVIQMYSSGESKMNGSTVQYQSSSSRRYKHDIKPLEDAHKLLDIPVVSFVYNEGHNLQYGDMAGQTLPGFIAEDVDEHYPAAVIHDREGKVESWDERRIIPGMLALIQEQAEKIKDLESRLARLENFMEEMMNDGK